MYRLLADLSMLSGEKEIDESIWAPNRDYPVVHRYIYELGEEEVMIVKLKYSEDVFARHLRSLDTEIWP